MQKIELTHTHYRDLMRRTHAYVLRATWYALVLLPVVLLPFIAEGFSYLNSMVATVVIGIGTILVSLSRRRENKRVPLVIIFLTIFAFFLGISTLVAGGSFDGFLGRDLGSDSVFGIVIAVLGMWFTFQACTSARDTGRYAIVFVCGVVILASMGFLSGVSANISFSGEQITPIAFITLSACIATLHATRARMAVIVAVAGALASLILLVISEASPWLLIVSIFISGIYGMFYIRELLHEIIHTSTPRIGMLLGKQHFHRAGIATFVVFFILITMVLFPQLKNILPDATPHTQSVYASREETRATVLKILDNSTLVGEGFGFSFERAWQELFLTADTDTILEHGNSLFYEYVAAGGVVGIILLGVGLITLLIARVRIKYAPRFYDHGWYAIARVSFVAVCAGVVSLFFLHVGETPLIFIFALIGIFAASYQRLTIDEADSEKRHAMQRKIFYFALRGFCIVISFGIIFYIILHAMALSRFLEMNAYAYIPTRTFLLEDIEVAMGNFSALTRSSPESETVLEGVNNTTARVVRALEKYPHAVVVHERAFTWFYTLRTLGVKGTDERIEAITKTLTEIAPRNFMYRLARAEVLVRLGKADDALSLLASPELNTLDEARRVRVDALVALGRFNDAKQELLESRTLSESMYGKLTRSLLFARTGAYREASVELEKFIREYPDIIDGYVYLAETYHTQGDTIRARSVLEKGSLRATKGNWELFRVTLEQITSTSTMSR